MSSATSGAGPVAPSGLVRTVVPSMVRGLNPLIRKAASKRSTSMPALLSHSGRRSGKQYTTPVGGHVRGSDCLVPRTFGSESDWSRNIRAGSGKIRWKGRDFEVWAPEAHRADDIKPLVNELFSGPARLGFNMLGIESFLFERGLPVSDMAAGPSPTRLRSTDRPAASLSASVSRPLGEGRLRTDDLPEKVKGQNS